MLAKSGVRNMAVVWLAYLLIFLIMCFFCTLSPLIADDFCQMGVAPFSVKKAFFTQWWLYCNLNSRLPAHLFNTFVILRAEWIHTILAPLAFIGIIFAIQVLVWGEHWKRHVRWYHPLCTFAILWIFTPAFGQAYLWRSGSASYCYTTLVSLLYLIPFRLLLDRPEWRPAKPLLFLLFGVSFLAGWSNENLGITNVLGSLAFLCYLYKKQRKIFAWALVLAGICLVGWLCLMFSPGNFGRIEQPMFASYRNSSLYTKLMWFLTFLCDNEVKLLPLSAIVIAGFIWSIYKKKFTAQAFAASVYFILFQLSLGAFLFSPVPPPRAVTASVVFLCVSTMFFLETIPIEIVKKGIASILIVLCAYSSIENGFIFIKQQEIIIQRKEAIKNSTEPVFNRYYPGSGKYFFPNSLNDMDVDWVAHCFRRHHKVNKIILR